MKTKKAQSNDPSEYPIESNVDIPPRESSKVVYPWRQMKVGDSFFVAGNSTALRSKIATCAYSFAKHNKGYYFTVRQVPDGYRVWRVANKRARRSV